ncbi:MAG TPA: hypothetical protein VE198_05810, partial [Actinoallomurus sp.]|nr:hypothetical protein [Actinoallomurus sp.]
MELPAARRASSGAVGQGALRRRRGSGTLRCRAVLVVTALVGACLSAVLTTTVADAPAAYADPV